VVRVEKKRSLFKSVLHLVERDEKKAGLVTRVRSEVPV
jgi:hypothetical protein